MTLVVNIKILYNFAKSCHASVPVYRFQVLSTHLFIVLHLQTLQMIAHLPDVPNTFLRKVGGFFEFWIFVLNSMKGLPISSRTSFADVDDDEEP